MREAKEGRAARPLTEHGYTRAIARELELAEAVDRYERKVAYWIGKLISARKAARGLRRRIEEAEQAKREEQAAKRTRKARGEP